MSISLTSEMGEEEHLRFIQSQKMAKSMVEGKTSNFWAEVKSRVLARHAL